MKARDAAPRCWCEIVNGRRHIADGCPTHDAATSQEFVEERTSAWGVELVRE